MRSLFRKLGGLFAGPAATPAPAPPDRPAPDAETLAALARLAGHVPGARPDATQLLDTLRDWRDQHPEAADAAALHLYDAAAARLQGRLDEAEKICHASLAHADIQPAGVHLELALIAWAGHDLAAAVDALSVAVSLDPQLGAAWLRLGDVLIRLDRLAEAETALREALPWLADEPLSDAWFLLGETLRMRRRDADARSAYEASLALQPGRPAALIALGHAHLMAEEEEKALACYEEAMRQTRQVPPEVQLNVGSIRQNLGDFQGARTIFERLLSDRPGDHLARWYLCQLDLLQCRWEAGWSNYPSRHRAGASPYRPMPYANWDGRPLLDQTLLVLADQGLGDEIMFASCLPDLQRRAPQAIVECEPRLLALFQRSFPALRFIATQRENSTDWLAGCPTPSWQIASGDLPALFRRADGDFPRHTGYLKADPARVARWHERLSERAGGRPRVGISWRGGLAATRTRARSIGVADWGPMLAGLDMHLVNLQYGDVTEDLAAFERLHGIRLDHDPAVIADYDETAALVCALDLVVSVCTSVIHLAGALGRPVWILTPHSPGWRYTADRDHLPWYPSSRIFRQARAGDWDHACRELSVALTQLTRNVSRGPTASAQTPTES